MKRVRTKHNRFLKGFPGSTCARKDVKIYRCRGDGVFENCIQFHFNVNTPRYIEEVLIELLIDFI